MNVGGKLVVSFITDKDFTSYEAECTRGTSANGVLRCDQGLTWGGKLTVGEVVSVWPGLAGFHEISLLMYV